MFDFAGSAWPLLKMPHLAASAWLKQKQTGKKWEKF